MIEECLRELGYTGIERAATEAQAIASAEARCPDLITSDVRLSAGCGIAAVQTICSGKRIPVVFVTGTGWEVHARMDDAMVVGKPFTLTDLSQVLAKAR